MKHFHYVVTAWDMEKVPLNQQWASWISGKGFVTERMSKNAEIRFIASSTEEALEKAKGIRSGLAYYSIAQVIECDAPEIDHSEIPKGQQILLLTQRAASEAQQKMFETQSEVNRANSEFPNLNVELMKKQLADYDLNRDLEQELKVLQIGNMKRMDRDLKGGRKS